MLRHLVHAAVLFILCVSLIPVSHAMGYLREAYFNQTETAKCMAISTETSVAYLIYTNNMLISASYNSGDLSMNSTFISTLPSNWSNKVVTCAYSDKMIYARRDDGAYAIINTLGLPIFISGFLSRYVSPLLISPYTATHNPSVHKLYAWTNETNQIVKFDFDVITRFPLSLGFVPTYGYCRSGYIFLFGTNKFAAISDPTMQPTLFDISFVPGGGGVYDLTAYFVTMECPQMKITSFDLQLYTVTSTYFNLNTNCTNRQVDNTTAHIDFSSERQYTRVYMYLYLANLGTIFKFSIPSLALEDQLSTSSINTWIDFAGILGPANILVGYQTLSSSLLLHLFFSTTCPPGYYFDSELCIQCPLWTHPSTPFLANYSCTPCPRDYYAPDPGICEKCSDGYYNGTIPCPPCPLGWYYNGSTCSPCSPGYYGIIPGECSPCQNGSISSEGDWKCSQCDIGYTVEQQRNLSSCVPCPKNFYGSSPGICTLCPPGSYTNNTGMTACIAGCGFGEFIDNNNTCSPCPMGTYAVNNTCKTCPSGTFGNETGGTYCLDCEGGTYSISTEDPSSCTICPNKFYAPARSSRCYPCPPGTRANGAKAVACVPCQVGYVSESLSLVCTKCSPGSEQTSPSQCTPCPEGTSTKNSNETIVCSPCGPNTYSPTIGQSSCTPCPRWHYSTSNSTKCSSCIHDIWGRAGCIPTAQICIGILVPLAVLVIGMAIYKFWWKKRTRSRMDESDQDGISMVPIRFRKIEDSESFESSENFENFENSENNTSDDEHAKKEGDPE